MKYLSLFSGIGGFELAIKQAYETQQSGPDTALGRAGPYLRRSRRVSGSDNADTPRPVCVGYSEIDPHALELYQRHFPAHANLGDIVGLDASVLPEFDLLVGGFPCQAFSIAGKRGGFTDTRGTLFFEIVRIAQEKRPRLLLLENVKGLLSHDKGRTFAAILLALDAIGYDCQWEVLNAKNFGVPQNRERVFIVGHLRGTPRPEVFPLGACARRHAASHEQPGPASHCLSTHAQRSDPTAQTYIAHALKARFDSGYDAKHPQTLVATGVNRPSRGFEPRGDGLACTVRAGESGSKNLMTDGFAIRRLTPVECERLQGFPDGWTAGVSDTQRYRCLGNAVAVPVVRAVAERLIPYLT